MNVVTMKAAAVTGYGNHEVLQVQEFERPKPQAHEILVQVKATPVTTADAMMRSGNPFFARFFLGLSKPKNIIPGTGFAGIVVELGDAVQRFQIGDAVFGETAMGFRANAEFVCLPEDGIVIKKPNSLSFAEAATACDGLVTSLNFIQNLAHLQAGQKILINGASGSLGTAAVQIAKQVGAHVTGVCSTRNIELVQSLGADQVIDYTTTDFTRTGERYDVIYDTIGKSSFSKSKRALKSNGIYMSPVLKLPLLFQMLWSSNFGKKKAKFSATGLLPKEAFLPLLNQIKEGFTKGQLKAVIDKSYPLEAIREAHQYIDTGRKRGNVVLVP